jgi:hypothetical protein
MQLYCLEPTPSRATLHKKQVIAEIIMILPELHEIRAFLSVFTKYRGADKSLARPGRKQATATEDFDVHISYLYS